jgi:hypothetical protein
MFLTTDDLSLPAEMLPAVVHARHLGSCRMCARPVLSVNTEDVYYRMCPDCITAMQAANEQARVAAEKAARSGSRLLGHPILGRLFQREITTGDD